MCVFSTMANDFPSKERAKSLRGDLLVRYFPVMKNWHQSAHICFPEKTVKTIEKTIT